MNVKEAVGMLLDCEAIHRNNPFEAHNMFVEAAGEIMTADEARYLIVQAKQSPFYQKEIDRRAKKYKEFRDGKIEVNS